MPPADKSYPRCLEMLRLRQFLQEQTVAGGAGVKARLGARFARRHRQAAAIDLDRALGRGRREGCGNEEGQMPPAGIFWKKR